MMKHALLLVLIFLIAGTLHAEIALVLETTIPLPSSGGWDVQHWMSDSTFGWACLRRDTILYRTQPSDSVRWLVIPREVWDPNNPSDFAFHEKVKVLRLNREESHAFVLVQSRTTLDDGSGWSRGSLTVTLYDATADGTVGAFFLQGGGSDNYGMFYYDDEDSVSALVPWPPAPLSTSRLFTVLLSSDNNYHDSGHCTSDEHWRYGNVWMSDLTSTGFDATNLTRGSHVSPFSQQEVVRIAMDGSYHYSYSYWCDDGSNGGSHSDTCWVNTYLAASGLGRRYDSLCCASAEAQQDQNGTARLILRNTWGRPNVYAVDATNYSLLWQDSTITGTINTGQIGGNGDERVLAYQSQSRRFKVYNASNGAFLDSTAAMLGNLQYLIKRPGHLSEFVTFDSLGNTVRVYRTIQPDPTGLTCIYIPENNHIRLEWPLTGASQYYVYSASTPGTVETLEAVVPAPNHSVELPVQGFKRFYFVTAESPAR